MVISLQRSFKTHKLFFIEEGDDTSLFQGHCREDPVPVIHHARHHVQIQSHSSEVVFGASCASRASTGLFHYYHKAHFTQ